ncbi:hypothetical protein ACIP9H_33380 [Streptomyces sp. NPDC088732]|uniref:hypothetical protein n=1 Tax=Streptomyces sp. NPDC088732 TaxID=3365879 RepID=UPI00380140C8
MSSATGRKGNGFHMRTVNGGTPERIPTADALAEMNNAMMQPGKRAVRTMSAAHSEARIVYKDNRGEVLLRPATSAEADMDVKPEAERYAPGDRVVVRPVSFDPEKRTHQVFREYTGTVVSWGSPHYYVRAERTDEYGEGVRPCRVHELRPAAADMTGTLPPFADDQDVRAVLSALRTAGVTLAALSTNPGSSCADGAFVTPEPGDGNTGVRVSYMIEGWVEETLKARKDAKRRAEERTARNAALDSYAEALRAAGWQVFHVASASTVTPRTMHLLVWPPASAQA